MPIKWFPGLRPVELARNSGSGGDEARDRHATSGAAVPRPSHDVAAPVPVRGSSIGASVQPELATSREVDTRRCMLEWLERPPNFQTIMWQPTLGVRELEKADA